MDNKLLVFGIIIELIFLLFLLIKIKNSKKMRNRQPPLPKGIIKKLKLK